MISIVIPAKEHWDPISERFIEIEEHTLIMEHSLAAISEWEAKWKKPFLSTNEKNYEETIDYIKCMTINKKEINPLVYSILTKENLDKIGGYIGDNHTATWFAEEEKKGKSSEVVTSELMYYWLVALQIPFECQYWHLSRMLTLIRVCNEKNKPKKKMSKRDIMKRNNKLNAARRKKLGSKG